MKVHTHSHDEEVTNKVWHCHIVMVSLTRCCGPDAPVQEVRILLLHTGCIVAFCKVAWLSGKVESGISSKLQSGGHSAEWFGIVQSA